MTTHRIGIDVGGTFTDVVLVADGTGAVTVAKILNRPGARAATVTEGIERVLDAAGVPAAALGWVSHGTTITTNAVIERSGARTALVTNEGFRDVLEIGRFSRPAELIYRVHADRPPPLVPRRLRLGVAGRIDAEGREVTALDPAGLDRAIETIRAEEVESVAVCFLFSFLDPQHERTVGERLASACPGVDVILSSDILREFREFPRTSTTVFAAYVAPVLRRYLEDLLERLAERSVTCPLYVFQSNGGVARPEVLTRNPALTLLSGPAGAVVGAAHLCGQAGYRDLVTMDMGGTSLDVCLVRDGEVQVGTGNEIDHYPVATPMVDVRTVGAGGGSVVRVDPVGRVAVGPDSMGADPGPACYGQGGERPTLTDTNLLMGLINPDYFAGGDLRLDRGRAERAVAEHLAGPLGIDVEDAAVGTYRVATTDAAEAIRAISVERGHDPRELTLVAFGGGGPLHAAAVADELGIRTVLVPPFPGLFSARGIAVADFTHDYARSVLAPLEAVDGAALEAGFSALEAAAAADLDAEGIPPAQRRFRRSCDLRYVGQTTEIDIPLDGEEPAAARAGLAARFHARHRHLYSYSVPGEPVELVNLRLQAVGKTPKPPPPPRRPGEGAGADPRQRRVAFPAGVHATSVHRRDALPAGASLEGPAIVEEPSSTTVVPPGWRARVAVDASVVLHRAAPEEVADAG